MTATVIPLNDELIEMLHDVRTYIADHLGVPVEHIDMSAVGTFEGSMEISLTVYSEPPERLGENN